MDELMTQKASVLRSKNILPTLVLLLGLGLSAAAGWWAEGAIQAKATADFERGAERLANELVRRFQLPIYVLNGVRSLHSVVTGTRVKRADFKVYVESRNLEEEFPGVRGLGILQRVLRSLVFGS